MDSILGEVKRLKASVRAKAEHSFRRGKRQFAQVGLRYRGMRANTAQLRMVFAPSKLCMTRVTLWVLVMGTSFRTRRMRLEELANEVPEPRSRLVQRLRTQEPGRFSVVASVIALSFAREVWLDSEPIGRG